MAINISCRTCYPGDGITDHNELIKVLCAMDARIQQLEAEVKSLKMPNDAPPRPSLYDASAHVRPEP